MLFGFSFGSQMALLVVLLGDKFYHPICLYRTGTNQRRNEYHDCVYRWHTGRLFLSTSAARVRGFESLHQSTLGFSIVVWTTGIPPGALLLKLRGITASHEICLRWTERTFSSHLSFHPLLRRGTCKLILAFLALVVLQSQNVRQCLLQCFMFIQRPQERQI